MRSFANFRRRLGIEAVEPVCIGTRPIRANVFLNPDTHGAYGNVYVTLVQPRLSER